MKALLLAAAGVSMAVERSEEAKAIREEMVDARASKMYSLFRLNAKQGRSEQWRKYICSPPMFPNRRGTIPRG